MQSFCLRIKPLSVNSAWMVSKKTGIRFRSPEYKAYAEEVGWLLKALKVPKTSGRVSIDYKLNLKYFLLTDCDNCVKCLQDILVDNDIIDDDRHIMRFTAEKQKADEDSIFITIKEWEA